MAGDVKGVDGAVAEFFHDLGVASVVIGVLEVVDGVICDWVIGYSSSGDEESVGIVGEVDGGPVGEGAADEFVAEVVDVVDTTTFGVGDAVKRAGGLGGVAVGVVAVTVELVVGVVALGLVGEESLQEGVAAGSAEAVADFVVGVGDISSDGGGEAGDGFAGEAVEFVVGVGDRSGGGGLVRRRDACAP